MIKVFDYGKENASEEFVGLNKIAIYGAGSMVLSLIVLSLYIPWAYFLEISGNAFWYLIFTLAAIAAIFMKNPRASALVLTGAGAGGLLWLFNTRWVFNFQGFLSLGFYFYLIGSLAVTYAGVSRLKKMR